MTAPIVSVETFVVTLPRDVPYLGPLGPGERVNARGYVVRRGNGTIYPTVDRSVAVRVTTADGLVGWGETYGICAPRAVCEIVNDLLAPVLIGRPVGDVPALWDELYGLMRVRGAWSGFYTDALAALDIALWDLRARAEGTPLWQLLGERRRERVPAYVSGLPAATLPERVAMAREWYDRGYPAIKFAAVVSHDGVVAEFAALRAALGDEAELMVDLHWKFDPAGAVALCDALTPFRPMFAEAPVAPEDAAALAQVAHAAAVPIAAGEEWSTEHQARPRLAALAFVQPEMAHTGVTQFLRIANLAAAQGIPLAPHATIGTGLFLAASLHASAVVPRLWRHEWQHSIFGRNLALLDGDMACDVDGYTLPSGTGLGVAPGPAFLAHAEAVA